MARRVQRDPTMPSKVLLSILSLAAVALAGCTEKTEPAPAAKRDPNAAAAEVVPDSADRTARRGNRPPMPRHLGSGADDTATGAPRERGERPSREDMMARRDERRAEMLDKFDADKDGQLSEVERTAMQDARVTDLMTRIDGDQDGKLSKAELAAMPMRGRRGGPDFDRLDVDRDGFVTTAELSAAQPERRFRGDRGADDRGPDDRAPAPTTP